MSYLSNELNFTLKKHGLNQRDITRQTTISISAISRVCSGSQTYVADDDFDSILKVVAKTDEERAKLLRARIRDAYQGHFAHLVKLSIAGGGSRSKRFTPNDVNIDPDVTSAFEYLYGLAPSRPAVGEFFVLQAKMLG